MRQVDEKKKKYLLYTGIFLLMCLASFFLFIKEGKSFVWGAGVEDGLSQHFSALAYYGEYLREAVSNVFSGQFKLPMWDMSIGYGGDILQTLNYYAIGDPLNFLYGFVPVKHTEVMYNFMIIFRMYLAGVSFLLYTGKMKKTSYASVVGALVYVFCGFSFRLGLRHPFFLNSMIYLPLLFLGIEKIYKKEKPYLFILTVCFAACSNYYFLYMLTIFSIIYAWIRFYDYYTEQRIKNFFMVVGRFAFRYIIGIAMSAMILLPSVLGFLGNGRAGHSVALKKLIVYPLRHYVMFFENIIGYGNTGNNTNAGYLPIAGIAILFLLFSRRMHHKKYKIAFVACVVVLACPIFGFAFNGFSYANNRWGFVFSFIVALLISEMYPRFFYMSKRQKWGSGIGVLVYNIFLWVVVSLDIKEFNNPGVWMAGFLVALFYLAFLWFQKREWDNRNMVAQVTIMVLLVISVAVHGYYRFDTNEKGYTAEFMKAGESLATLQEGPVEMLSDISDDSTYRVHAQGCKYKNYGLINHLNTISGYYSITDGNVANTIKSYDTLGMQYLDKYHGLDQRTGLMSLASVKYMSVDETSDRADIPDGFEKVQTKGNIALYKNTHWLPFAYGYDGYITGNQYNALNGVGREQAMLSNAVMEDNIENEEIANYGVYDNVSVSTISLSDKRLSSPDGKEYMDVTVPVRGDQEIYLYMKGLRFQTAKNEISSELMLTGKKRVKGIVVKQNGVRKKIYVQSPTNPYYFGRDDYMIKLNHQKTNSKEKIRFNFLTEGDYEFENIYMVVVDKKATERKIAKLKENAAKNIQYEGNHFSCEYNAKKKNIVCVAIPYSNGWRATVDGKKTKVYKTNGMNMGVIVEKGQHKIQLTYRTPGMLPGFVISVAGILIFVGGIIYNKKKST